MTSENTQIKQTPDQANAEALLKIALNETQQSIRSYDTKAQICAIGYLLSLNLVLGINAAIYPEKGPDLWVVLFGWGVLILPMLFFGYVLYPTRVSIRASASSDQSSAYKVLYIRQERHTSVDQITRDALRANTLNEVAFELFQTSDLRDRKRVRFVRALAFAGLAFFIMFSVHLGTVVSRLSAVS